MWQTVEALGFEGGRVLEPGCGSGNFIGFAPDGAEITGVEMDATTAAVATHLYGAGAAIHARRFEEFSAPDGRFDLVVGNVPFAKVTPHDPTHNRGRHSLHNYFLVKSLHLTRPGGMVAAITSRYTLDARNPSAREELAGLADLVGAVRLPVGAFSESSGTDVVCDLLVLRRRAPDVAPAHVSPWVQTVPLPGTESGDEPVEVNEFFVTHPEFVAGRLGVTRGMYRAGELTVEPTAPLTEALPAALDILIERAGSARLTYVSRPAARAIPDETPSWGDLAEGDEEAPALEEGSFVITRTGGFAQVVDGELCPYRPRVRGDADELRRLIALRDAARAALSVQVAGGADAEVEAAQAEMGVRYDEYRRRYGPINRYRTARTGRLDRETGEEIPRRVRPRMGGFRADPDWPLVAALEVFDDETQRARPAPIFTERVIDPPKTRTTVDSAAEAVAVCLDETGTVTLERVAQLLDMEIDRAQEKLGDLVWEDPGSGDFVPAARYLSGNIRKKLAAARAAAERDSRFERHVPALEAVLPRQLEPREISARLGAPWIPADDVEAFCIEVFDAEADVEHLPGLGRWRASLREGRRASVALTSEWGTPRADGLSLLEASLNQRLFTVTDELDDGRRVRNEAETIAAREKQEAMSERFAAWVWEDPARSARLADRYNELFSSVVVPTYDGSHLSLPGLATTFTPHAHQRDAVARIVTEGRALLAHAVGAGKTATMVIAAMELRRLGLAAKPAVVVPNHMLDQFAREWLYLYPTARVLLAHRDRLSREHRKEFVARCATGEWDGIVFTQSGFARLPLGSDLLAQYLGEQVERCRAALTDSRNGKGLSVKRLERRLAQLEEMYQRLLAAERRDDGIRWEETGVDYLFVDEGHLYKNRRVDSSIEGMGKEGSQRAQDLDAKLWTLRRSRGERVVTFATATPIANSVAEMWTTQSYLQPDVLAEVDMIPFDAWAANFGRAVTAVELAPDGASYRLQTRFARFQNVPELMTMYRQVADVHTNEDLDLPIPAIAGDRPEVIVVPPSEDLRAYVADLAERAGHVRNRSVDPSEDNMLKITGDGRRAALDLRLVGLTPDPEGGKIAVAAARIAAIHHDTAELQYLDDSGEPSPRAGALQLVFCDVSTPAGEGWNAYDELRDQLVERGVSRDAIRYMHEAGTDEAKAKLFQACRDGRVSVLVGSTEKMGVGTNVQTRAVALHHLDCPWRPADIEQREGRILRQGNQNPEVSILRYVTEESFDIYMWQTVERKATFIAQVTTGKLAEREIDDIGDQALSYAEVKALATGNPLIVEKAGVDAELAKLTRLHRAHEDDQHRLRRTLEASERQLARAERRIADLTAAIGRRIDTRGDRFAMNLDGHSFKKRVDAGTRLKAIGTARLEATPSQESGDAVAVGDLAGFPLVISTTKVIEPEVRLALEDARIEIAFSGTDWVQTEPAALVQRLERRVQGLDDGVVKARDDADAARKEIERARTRLGQPFEHGQRLRYLEQRQKEIDEALLPAADTPGRGSDPPAASAPAASTDTTEVDVRRAEVADLRERLDRLAERTVQRTADRSL